VPLPHLRQRLTRAMHPQLERRYALAGRRRHLLVAQAFDMLEYERLALVGRQLSERPLYQGELVRALQRRLGVQRIGHGRRIVERYVRRGPACEMALAPVRYDPIQPGAEPRRLPTARQMPIGAYEAPGHPV